MPSFPHSLIRRHLLPQALRLPGRALAGKTLLMLSLSDSPNSDKTHLPKSKSKAAAAADYADNHQRGPLCFLHIYFSANPRAWVLLAALFIPALFLLLLRSSLPVSAAVRRFAQLPRSPPHAASCDLPGRFYVYDLPPMFNTDLSDDCESLNPWTSRCAALSNHGFGPPAGPALTGLVPDELLPAWHWTDQFASEIIYHRRMLWHPCRTADPTTASAFYVPFYGGLAVGKYLWSNFSARDRDYHGQKLLEWLANQETWRRSGGSDHFMMLGRITWDFRRSKDKDWGGSFLHMQGMRNVTRLLIERNPWDRFDVGVPYPTGFHPRSVEDVRGWQRYVLGRPRPTLFCFAGATRAAFRNDFRALLLGQCAAAGELCRAVDCGGGRCGNGSAAALELFLGTEFCLQPRGDSYTRRSTFDCMLAGAIPVFFWTRTAYEQYSWHLPGDPAEWSVFVDRREVAENGTALLTALESLGLEKRRRMREKIVEYLPRLVYAWPKDGLPGVADALDVAVEGVLRQFQEEKSEQWK